MVVTFSPSSGESSDSAAESDSPATSDLDNPDITGCAASAGPQHRSRVKRILDRAAGASQSKRVFHVVNARQTYVIFLIDIFHTLLHVPFVGLFFAFLLTYVACFTLFALCWWFISEPCAIELDSFTSAFYFSVETQMTIGYGAPKENFDGCAEAAFLLPLQVVAGLTLDAAVIGIVFAQVSAASAHAASVVFSDTALLQVIDGCVHLSFRIAKRTGFTLSQGKIQVYCVQHHKDPSQPKGIRVEINAMHLIEPDMDTYNGVIFLGLPAEVCHKVDFSSPLAPVVPPGTDGKPTPEEVQSYLRSSKYLEILVLVSGIEQTTAASFEARHSYTLDDIFWHRTFRPCVSINPEGYHCVDLNEFHQSHDIDMKTPGNAAGLSRANTAHSFAATLDHQVADWTIYTWRSAPRPPVILEDLFKRQNSQSDEVTRQYSYSAGESPSSSST